MKMTMTMCYTCPFTNIEPVTNVSYMMNQLVVTECMRIRYTVEAGNSNLPIELCSFFPRIESNFVLGR